MKNKIDSSGFNSTYTNEDFLRELVNCNLNYEKITEIIDLLNTKVNDNLMAINATNNDLSHEEIAKRKSHNEKNYNKINLLKQIALFLTSSAIITSLIFGSIKLSKVKKYAKTITTYSPKNGITTETKYERGKKDKTIIYEFTPYEEYDSKYGEFRRSVTKYNVSEITNIPLEEYLDLDLAKLSIDNKSYTELKSSLSLDDTYEETFRYVEKSIVNEDDYQEKTSIGGLIALLALSAIIEALIELLFIRTDFNDDFDYPALITAINNIKNDIASISKHKHEEEKFNKKIKELNEKSEKLLLENKDLINRLLSYYENIKNNPEYYEESEKIEKTLRRIKEKENN